MLGYGNGLNKFNYISLQKYVLDSLTGWVLAFSLYLLTNTYKGRCVRVRRSSDDAEQDFYFNNGFVTVLSILIFVGAGNDGFVCNWGNQYKLGNEAVQATAANQPKIVESGSFLYNGVKFDNVGVGTIMDITSYSETDITIAPLSIYCNYSRTLSHTGYIISRNTSSASNVQYGILSWATKFALVLNGLITLSADSTIDSKSMFDWASIDSNDFIVKTETAETINTRSSSLVSADSLTLGGRKESATYGTLLSGNIETVILFNKGQYANYDLLAANC